MRESARSAQICHGFARLCSGGALPAGVVDRVLAGQDDLRHGDDGVPVLDQRLDNAGQGLRRVDGGVVEQYDGAGLDAACDPLGDLVCGDLLPVQTVPTGSGWKCWNFKKRAVRHCLCLTAFSVLLLRRNIVLCGTAILKYPLLIFFFAG